MCSGSIAENGVVTRPEGVPQSPGKVAVVLAVVGILWSALHFWPLEGSKTWQLLYPANLAPLVWGGLLVTYALIRGNWSRVAAQLPHVSVLAFLTVTFLSAAFAQSGARAASFSIKLALMYLGGYALFRAALGSPRAIRTVMGAVLVAVTVCVLGAVTDRFVFRSDGVGFFGSAYKHGTYVGVLAPLGGAYLITAGGWQSLAGSALIVLAVVSSNTLGGLAAAGAGMILLSVVSSSWRMRAWAVGSLVCGIGLALVLGGGVGRAFTTDLTLAEADGENLRQRYVEWQAEINLLADRTVTGTGAGSINDYRSAYYHRLPKLNTLAAFDQNGWLATAAETGVLGLVAFCWIAGCHFRMALAALVEVAWQSPLKVTDRCTIGGLVALGAACVAHAFSSVHYNGVLIAFVLVLAIVSRHDHLAGETSDVVS